MPLRIPLPLALVQLLTSAPCDLPCRSSTSLCTRGSRAGALAQRRSWTGPRIWRSTRACVPCLRGPDRLRPELHSCGTRVASTPWSRFAPRDTPVPLDMSIRCVCTLAQVEFRFGGEGEPVGPWAHRLVDEFYGEDVDEGDAEMNAVGAGGGGTFSFGAPQGDASIGLGPPPLSTPPAAPHAGPIGRGSAAAILPAWMTGGAAASMR